MHHFKISICMINLLCLPFIHLFLWLIGETFSHFLKFLRLILCNFVFSCLFKNFTFIRKFAFFNLSLKFLPKSYVKIYVIFLLFLLIKSNLRTKVIYRWYLKLIPQRWICLIKRWKYLKVLLKCWYFVDFLNQSNFHPFTRTIFVSF